MIRTFLFLGEPRGLIVIELALLVWVFFAWRMYQAKRQFRKQKKLMGLRSSFRPFFLPEKTISSTGFEMYNHLAKERNRCSWQYFVAYFAFVILFVMMIHRTYPNAMSQNRHLKPPISQNDTTGTASE